MASQHNPYFDFLRGIAIIMVVGIHTLPANAGGFDSIEAIITTILRQMLNCAVPLFLAISGYFIAAKNLRFGKEHIEFLKKQIPKIYIPALVFSIPWLLLSISSGALDLGQNIVYFFLCGFSIYYFVALIIQYYILTPLFTKFNKWEGIIATILISIVSIVTLTYLLKVKGIDLSLLCYAGPFPLWIMFFFMGVYLSNHNRNYGLAWPIITILIGLALSIAEQIYWISQGSQAWGIKLSSFIFSAGVIWLFFAKKLENNYSVNIFSTVINYIGGISFGIYLLHVYIIAVYSKVIMYNGWLLNWVAILCLSCLTIWVVKKVVPSFAKKYLGFR